ncbi:MAG: helix-turn-helix domain-containing protein [Proteobacteria bacterium]|nr:helix-turn-helix domain-containing protein [Pseudomonadota bacterium]
MIDLLADLPEPTGAEFRAIRLAAGHTQRQAAGACDLTANSVARIESGNHGAPSRQTMALYLLATGQHPWVRVVSR